MPVWDCHKNFNSFLGKDLQQFLEGCENLAEWIENNLSDSIKCKLLRKAFHVWCHINSFFKQVVLKEEDAPTFN